MKTYSKQLLLPAAFPLNRFQKYLTVVRTVSCLAYQKGILVESPGLGYHFPENQLSVNCITRAGMQSSCKDRTSIFIWKNSSKIDLQDHAKISAYWPRDKYRITIQLYPAILPLYSNPYSFMFFVYNLY